MSKTDVWFNGSRPILRVADMQRSLQFYREAFGFEPSDWSTEDFADTGRDKAGVYLCRGAQGAGKAWAYIGVDDAEKLYQHLVSKGIAVRLPPTNFTWAMEIHVEDPDGNVLRLGSDPDPTQPEETKDFG